MAPEDDEPGRDRRRTTATITGTIRRPERGGPPEAGATRRSPSIAVGRSPGGTGPRPSTRVGSVPADGSCTPPGGAGHACGPGCGGGGHRGAYQESQGSDSDCGSGAAAVAPAAAPWTEAERGPLAAAPSTAGTAQRRERPVPANQADQRSRLHGVPARRVTGTRYTRHKHQPARPRVRARQPERADCGLVTSHWPAAGPATAGGFSRARTVVPGRGGAGPGSGCRACGIPCSGGSRRCLC